MLLLGLGAGCDLDCSWLECDSFCWGLGDCGWFEVMFVLLRCFLGLIRFGFVDWYVGM